MTNTAGIETTGRYLVLLEPGAAAAGARAMNQLAGLRLATTADAALGAAGAEQFDQTDGIVLHELGVAVVTADPDQALGLRAAAAEVGPISVVEAERVVYAIGPAAPVTAVAAASETTLTWGLQAIGATSGGASGAGVRVAVLDTGLDLNHPDLAGRNVISRSFITGEAAQDGHGHGTHCIGTSCGLRTVSAGPGYGVAYQADIYAGKVLSNRGSGADGGILSGISWAVTNRCRVVSMSLGSPTQPGQAYSRVYEQAAQRAMQQGTLIIAAAGNESDRKNGRIAPVGHPANCPSIMAVAAVDVNEKVANFSCGTVDKVGQVDVAGPGVDVYSTWPMPTRYRRISGTSMATPHVAGVAALIAGQNPQASPQDIWTKLVQTARRLNQPSTDVGAGLVQVP